jgi:hypothetical protein
MSNAKLANAAAFSSPKPAANPYAARSVTRGYRTRDFAVETRRQETNRRAMPTRDEWRATCRECVRRGIRLVRDAQNFVSAELPDGRLLCRVRSRAEFARVLRDYLRA